MIGKECVRPIRLKHSDWCGLASIVQAIVEMFLKNCTLMFPPAPVPVPSTSFSGTFKPTSSEEEEDDDDMLGAGGSFCRFETSTPTSSFTSAPLPYGGAFIMVSDNKGMPSGVSCTAPGDQGGRDWGPANDKLDLEIEADDEADGDKEVAEDAVEEPNIDPDEMEMLKTIIKKIPASDQLPTAPKSGDKWGSTHIDGDSGLSDSSAEDLDASRSDQPKKKGGTPTKATSPNQWSKEDIDIVRQIHYKVDLQCFQTYRTNKIDPADLTYINTKDHSAYLEVACADPGLVIRKSVFSVAAYWASLEQQGSDISKFDKEVGTNFKKGAKGSRAPNSEKVPIDRVMLVC